MKYIKADVIKLDSLSIWWAKIPRKNYIDYLGKRQIVAVNESFKPKVKCRLARGGSR